jgi:hypothetical protein
MDNAPTATISEHFSNLDDPRGANRWHLLLDIIVIAICAAICGAVTMPHWGTLNDENTCARGALPHGAGCGTLWGNGRSEVGSNLVPRA